MSAEYSADSTDQERREAKVYLNNINDSKLSHAEMIEIYDTSFNKYEKDMSVVNYNAPSDTAAYVAKLYPNNRENVNVLDVAAGTGLCAAELLKHGFKKMDAFDGSKQMLEIARTKDLYGRYICDMLGENTLDIEDDTYDVVTICGMTAYILISLPVKPLEELIRVLKPGGYVVITSYQTTFEDTDLRRNMETLEYCGKWRQIDARPIKGYVHGLDGIISVHKVC